MSKAEEKLIDNTEVYKYLINNNIIPHQEIKIQLGGKNNYSIVRLSETMQAYADQEVKESKDLLEKFTVGFEWDMENKHPKPDRSDYEFYDEVKAYLNKLKTDQ